jgi:hypothetical protein
MATATFDTLKYANTLKEAGVPDKQAEAQATVLAEALAVNFKELATKDDLTAAIGSLRAEIALVRPELQSDLRETEQRLNARIDTPFARLERHFNQLIWMSGLTILLQLVVFIRVFCMPFP